MQNDMVNELFEKWWNDAKWSIQTMGTNSKDKAEFIFRKGFESGFTAAVFNQGLENAIDASEKNNEVDGRQQ